MRPLRQHVPRVLGAVLGAAAVTYIAHVLVPVNAATAGFAYLLYVLLIASTWGFIEALAASLAATLCFNLYFLPPIGALTIADPENWVALFSFLATSLIASRLSTKAEQRAREALERQRDVERLYTFSRSILLIDGENFAKQLAMQLAEVFALRAVVLYDRRSDQLYHAGPADFEGMEEQLRDAALRGSSYSDETHNRVITAVRLGSEPIAALALQGAGMADSVLQGIANLVAIGLERAKAQQMAGDMEAARRNEQLRTTLIDAMAHEFKTPLTSIKAVTTSLLADPTQPLAVRTELLNIADEEADHLKQLIDDSVEMARLDTSQITVHPEPTDVRQILQNLVAEMRPYLQDRKLEILGDAEPVLASIDRRLVHLAMKQLLDNALKYSHPGTQITIRIASDEHAVTLGVSNFGEAISAAEQRRIFERFYRSPRVKAQIPGSGLGLSIVESIVHAHHGNLSVESRDGQTTFRMTLVSNGGGAF